MDRVPDNQEEARFLAIQYRKTGRYSDAIRLWQQIPIHRADDHLNYGAALAGARNERAAIQEYRKALRLRPDYYRAWCNLVKLSNSGPRNPHTRVTVEPLRLKENL